MRILTIGSLNLDHVYRVPHFVRPGETLASDAYQCGPGGKGLNQSVAAARAGARVAHAGCVGSDGDRLLRVLEDSGVDTSKIPLDLVDLMVLNQTEAVELSGEEDEEAALAVLVRRYPDTEFVLTLGANGCHYRHGDTEFTLPAERVEAVDTTAAGDCFVGYLAAALAEGQDRSSALKLATRAAALTVQRPGAADSIPWRKEIT